MNFYACKYAKNIGKEEELIYCSLNDSLCSFESPNYNICNSKYNGDINNIIDFNNTFLDEDIIYDEIGVDDIGE